MILHPAGHHKNYQEFLLILLFRNNNGPGMLDNTVLQKEKEYQCERDIISIFLVLCTNLNVHQLFPKPFGYRSNLFSGGDADFCAIVQYCLHGTNDCSSTGTKCLEKLHRHISKIVQQQKYGYT